MTKEDLGQSIADIVKAIDGESIYSDCVLGLKACSEKNPCPLHDDYKEIKRNLLTLIEGNTISEFRDKLNSNRFFLKND